MYLITGAHGQLGQSLHSLLGDRGLYVDRDVLDIGDAAQVESSLRQHRPECVINCAAYTAVDKAESDRDAAAQANAAGPANLAKAAGLLQIPLIHVSTDYVFDGTACRPYREDDVPCPQSVYGLTKLAGERAVLQYAETAAVVRTAWLYSVTGNNFVKTMRRLGRERDTIRVVADQVGTPTYAPDLAAALLSLVDLIKPGTREIYHYTNEGVCSWYDFAVAIMELSGLHCKVEPIRSEEYPTPAQRPAYSVLDKSKIRSLLPQGIPYWRNSLKQCLQLLESNE